MRYNLSRLLAGKFVKTRVLLNCKVISVFYSIAVLCEEAISCETPITMSLENIQTFQKAIIPHKPMIYIADPPLKHRSSGTSNKSSK